VISCPCGCLRSAYPSPSASPHRNPRGSPIRVQHLARACARLPASNPGFHRQLRPSCCTVSRSVSSTFWYCRQSATSSSLRCSASYSAGRGRPSHQEGCTRSPHAARTRPGRGWRTRRGHTRSPYGHSQPARSTSRGTAREGRVPTRTRFALRQSGPALFGIGDRVPDRFALCG